MKEEKLIKKWLNDELSAEELEAFKQLDAYSSYIQLSEKAKHFAAPAFDDEQALQELKSKLEDNQASSSPSKTLYRYIAGIAAVLVIGFALFYYVDTTSNLKSFETQVAHEKNIQLPDQSKVVLSANSSLAYNLKSWKDHRHLELKGEAFFDVETGETFQVETNKGMIKVLGTKFNVKSRDYSFQVTCYEGSVSVNSGNTSITLKAKEQALIQDNRLVKKQVAFDTPDWRKNHTTLKSMPLRDVLKEFQNYYNYHFETSAVDTSRLYTGSFPHKNIEIALKSITLPLDLTYQIKDKTVIFANK